MFLEHLIQVSWITIAYNGMGPMIPAKVHKHLIDGWNGRSIIADPPCPYITAGSEISETLYNDPTAGIKQLHALGI